MRDGGLAIYGGIIAGVITGVLVCKRKKIPVLALGDLAAFGLLIGQAIGRWGNFINREAFGVETDIFCRMGLTTPDGVTVFVHPTFLSESLWNFTGLIILYILLRRGARKYDGQFTWLYVLWYGLGRAPANRQSVYRHNGYPRIAAACDRKRADRGRHSYSQRKKKTFTRRAFRKPQRADEKGRRAGKELTSWQITKAYSRARSTV